MHKPLIVETCTW